MCDLTDHAPQAQVPGQATVRINSHILVPRIRGESKHSQRGGGGEWGAELAPVECTLAPHWVAENPVAGHLPCVTGVPECHFGVHAF